MARSNRNAASNKSNKSNNVDSLDNIDLDDIFADDGDALFDGIDLGIDMDEIETSAPAGRSKRKRISKPPAFLDDDLFLDDDDDDSEPKKKRKKKKTATKKVDNSSSHSKNKKTSVATPGQFGGRPNNNKKRSSAVSKANPPSSKIPKTQPPPAPPPPPPPVGEEETVLTLPQPTFCGLYPDTTVFYPFLPKLPPEPSIASRKLYGFIDRIHSSFISHLSSSASSETNNKADSTTATPKNDDSALLKLMQEACREPHQLQNLSNTIANVRQTISVLDRRKLAKDWYNVLALLQRQHDFLRICGDNMERWCRHNFSIDDYAEVYLDLEKSKLSGFSSREVTVKLQLNNLKDMGPLVAVLPKASVKVSEKTMKEKDKKNLKKKPAVVPPKPSTTTTASTKPPEPSLQPKAVKQVVIPPRYANMKPIRRRKNVEVMMSQTARRLEAEFYNDLEVKFKKLEKSERELRKLIEDDPLDMNHTKGMWKYLEVSGLFGPIEKSETQELFGELRAEPVENKPDCRRISSNGAATDIVPAATVFDRLQSLLVDEEDGEDSDTDMMLDDDYNMEFDEIVGGVTSFVDISQLSESEKACVHLHRLGLGDYMSLVAPLSKPAATTTRGDTVSVTQNGMASEKLPAPSTGATAHTGQAVEAPKPSAIDPSMPPTESQKPLSVELSKPWVESEPNWTMEGMILENSTTTPKPTVEELQKLRLVSTDSTQLTGEGNKLLPATGDAATAAATMGPEKPPLTLDHTTKLSDSNKDETGVTTTSACAIEPPKQTNNVDELEVVIDNMIADLTETDEINNARISFLEDLCRASHLSSNDIILKQQQEANLAAKCQQLMRKAKEHKSRKIAKKADSFALPW